MANASYSIYLYDDTYGNVALEVIRDPTTISLAGTRLKVPWIDNVFGTAETAYDITGATNATPIVLTTDDSAAGLASGDLVLVEGVLGTTHANGTFILTSTTNNTTATLLRSGVAGNQTYISGGTIRKIGTTKNYASAIAAALVAIGDDKADGN